MEDPNLTLIEETVYVPRASESTFTHDNIIYADVIGKDVSGIQKVRVHSEANKYEMEDASDSEIIYFIPKFTWEG